MQKFVSFNIDTTIDNEIEIPKRINKGDILKFTIKVFNNSVLADLTNDTVNIVILKADGKPIEDVPVSKANGIVTFELSEQATLAIGTAQGTLQITESSTSHLSTNIFTYYVNESITDSVLAESETEIKSLGEVMAIVKNNTNIMNTYVEEIQQIAGTTESVQALSEIKSYIDTNLSSLEAANNEAEINITNETAQNTQATQNIASLTSKNTEASSNISSLTTKNAEATSNISALDSKNSTASQNITNLDSKNAEATSNIAALDSKNTTATTNIADLNAENEQAQANIEAMQNFGDVTQLTQTVTNVKNEIEGARGTEVNLDTRLDKFDISLSEIEQDVTANTSAINAINSSLSSLGANDLAAREEIMDIKLKLKEQSSVNFINKTGVGGYDTFDTNSYIDMANTTATYNSTNKAVDFIGSKTLKMVDETFDNFSNLDIALYPSKINKATVSGAVNNSNTVVLSATDKVLTNGDKLFMNNVLNEVTNSVSNFTTYDRTTPVSVINSAYTTSANARPQRISNGWWVLTELNGTVSLILYVSKDEGQTWEQLCYRTLGAGNAPYYISTCSYGNMVFVLLTAGVGGVALFYKLDVTTMSNIDMSGTTFEKIVDTQTSMGNCSIGVNSLGHLTLAWSCKNATYPNSFNLRSVKTLDFGTTFVKQDGTSGVDQVTNINITGYNFSNPYVIYDKNDKPIIVFAQNTPNWYICNSIWTGTAWSNTPVVYSTGSSSYTQSNPIATLQKYGTNAGRIWVVWYGLDSVDTTKYNIRISYSDDNGVTWSTPVKLTSGNIYYNYYPSITTDINGNVYVIWIGVTSTNPTCNNIRMLIYNGTSWGNVNEITSQNTNNMWYPSLCDNYYNFERPITIWQDNANNRVAFYGKWQVGQGYTLTMQNPVTLTDGIKIPIVDLIPQQNNVDLTIDSVDTEKFTFKAINLNTNIASIKVNGKDNSLNALAYAVA